MEVFLGKQDGVRPDSWARRRWAQIGDSVGRRETRERRVTATSARIMPRHNRAVNQYSGVTLTEEGPDSHRGPFLLLVRLEVVANAFTDDDDLNLGTSLPARHLGGLQRPAARNAAQRITGV